MSLQKLKFLHCRYSAIRQFCMNVSKNTNQLKELGQPTHYSHPHLLKCGEVTPMITKEEYQFRRKRFVQMILEENKTDNYKALVVIPSAMKQYMSDKIPYFFRQNTDFLYLTGCLEPDCCLAILIDGPDKTETILFTRNRDDHAELWDGPRTHPEDACSFFGVDTAFPLLRLESFIDTVGHKQKGLTIWYDFKRPVQTAVHNIMTEFITKSTKKIECPVNLLHKQRLIKSPSEIALMQRSCDITSKAFIAAMKDSNPGILEDQIFAKIDYHCRMRGAEFLAYPPVVAGGNRANIIHYINNNRIVQDKELVLVDAGCEFHGYASDITRTWPVNGKFNDYQKIIYEIVLECQEELIEQVACFPTLDKLFEKMCKILGKRLEEVGLLKGGNLAKGAYRFCPHHVSHYLGMDIHDTPTVPRTIPLQPGMVLTVEPGIYIHEKSTDVPEEFRGIGVRIEDDILVTVNGPVVLSRKCPKSVNEIEELVGNKCV